MFSSLPSASKIYVSSCKPKQKNLSSAKKKRKKSATNVSTSIDVYDEQTLVSSTSLRNCSANELSLNSHEESQKINSDDGILSSITGSCDEFQNQCKGSLNVQSDDITNSIRKFKSSKQSSSLPSVRIQITKSETEESRQDGEKFEQRNMTNVISDSIYCDECLDRNIHETDEAQKNLDTENTEQLVKISVPEENYAPDNAECLKSNESEEVNSLLPAIQLTTVDSVFHSLEKEHSTDNSDMFYEKCSNPDVPVAENVDNEDLKCNQDLTSVFPVSESIKLNCGINETLSSTLHVINESKDKISDIDSSSVRSDCYASTTIYDIHVVNSEHSSVDENQLSGGEDCRIQSPDQSETSCTESIMYDAKNNCQNESAYQLCSTLEEEFGGNHTVSKLSYEKCSDTINLSEKISYSSHNIANIGKFKSNYILKHSLSLPEKISNFKNIELFRNEFSKKVLNAQRSDLSNYFVAYNKIGSTSDKSTFTADRSNSMSNKSTITSDVTSISSSHNKKDVATTPIKNENKSVTTSFRENAKILMKVLPPVAVMQARARSYVFGSIGPTGSLLGNDELSRFFPDNNITVFIGTWNMNSHDPPESVDDFLLPLDIFSVPDIYAVGVQESMQSRLEWEILLQTTLGPSHVLFASTSFGVLHLCIFMRRDLIWFCSEPEEANIATRPGSMIKTKGAVAICFMFFGTSFLFVNSHLTAHEQKLRERLSDYEKICSALDLPKQIPLKPHQKGKDVTSRFDCVFWCGDLNFRVVQDRPSVLSFVEEKIKRPEPSCNLLMKHDQLTQAMAKGAAFHGFDEGVINFIPSYKFDVGTSCFDSAKQRVPSYTDRILYRCKDKSSINCLHYDAVPEIFTSDHKPVFAVFKVSIKPGRDNIPLAAGLFKRDVYLEAIKRRAQQLEVTRNHKQSTICNIM